jgi:hypothetical protein
MKQYKEFWSNFNKREASQFEILCFTVWDTALQILLGLIDEERVDKSLAL